MKKAMKLTTSILALAVMAGGWGAVTAAAQNPDAIDNARSVAKSLQQKQANDSNAALNAAGVPAAAKPATAQVSAKPAASQTQAASPAKSSAPQAAKSTAAAKPATTAKSTATPPPAKPATTAKSPMAARKPVQNAKTQNAKTKIAAKPDTAKAKIDAKPTDVSKTVAAKPEDKKPEGQKDDKKEEQPKWAMSGKRDPFFSPVVQQTGSPCSNGKKCLEINAINLRGVVKSDSGFIAVVTNNLGKAYFLRENDPVFNGFVVRITGDSVVFEETFEDKLGKPFTREVVKRIFTPAV
jgi:hypothetical protein